MLRASCAPTARMRRATSNGCQTRGGGSEPAPARRQRTGRLRAPQRGARCWGVPVPPPPVTCPPWSRRRRCAGRATLPRRRSSRSRASRCRSGTEPHPLAGSAWPSPGFRADNDPEARHPRDHLLTHSAAAWRIQFRTDDDPLEAVRPLLLQLTCAVCHGSDRFYWTIGLFLPTINLDFRDIAAKGTFR